MKCGIQTLKMHITSKFIRMSIKVPFLSDLTTFKILSMRRMSENHNPVYTITNIYANHHVFLVKRSHSLYKIKNLKFLQVVLD